jgi:tetratricopeptide (TPR) repeat protein
MKPTRRTLSAIFISIFFVSKIYSSFGFYLPSDSFRFECTLKSGATNVPGMMINVYLDDKKIIQKNSNKQGNFYLYLKHNKIYTLQLVKKDFIVEKVLIDTKVSTKLLNDKGIETAIDNEIPVFEFYQGMKTDMFELPVLCYIYNENLGYFEQDKKRSKQLNSVASKVSAAKTKLASDELKNANALYAKKSYVEALIAFSKVAELTPTNQQAVDRIKELNKLLKGDANAKDESKKNIEKADGLFKVKKYSEAKLLYKSAFALVPENKYPQSQVYLIDSLQTKSFLDNKGSYDKLKAKGDDALKEKKYEVAIGFYEDAQKLLPDESYPKNQIASINATLAAEKKKKEDEQKAIDDKFNSLLKKADDYKKNKDFANAIAIYDQALLVKPTDNATIELKKDAEKQLNALKIENFQKQKEQNYTDTLKLADNAFNNKDYKLAKILFKAASGIKPDEKYPITKIKEIEKIGNKPIVEKQTDTNQIKTKPEANEINTGNQTANAQINDLLVQLEEKKKSGNIVEISKVYSDIAEMYKDNSQLDKALDCLNGALNEVKKSGNKKVEANIISQIASVYYDSGQYKQTIVAYEQAIELKKQIGDLKGATETLSDMGVALTNVYQYDKAIDAYEEALELNQKMGNNPGIIDACDQLAGIYFNQDNYKKSVQYYNKAIAKAESMADKASLSNLKNSIGVVYYKMGNFDMAIKYYDQSIAIDKETGNTKSMSQSYNNIGNINFDWNKYEQAIEYYEKSLLIKRELNFEEGIAVSLYNIGNAYIEMRNLTKASEYLGSGLDLAKKLKFREVIQQTYKALSKIYELNNDFRNAVASYKAYSENVIPGIIIEGQFNESSNFYGKENHVVKRLRKELYRQKILAENEAMQNKQKEQQLAVKDLELKNQKSKTSRIRSLLLFSILILMLLSFLATQFYRRYKEKKLYGDVISFQKQQITDSIEYASRIQKAVLPPVELVKILFPESFIYNKPKDIVSGDYFYIAQVENKTYVAVADCTGHGVPGAFMSMLGLSLIKEVILMQEKAPTANEVLNQLRDSLMKSLHQTGRDDEAKDGIDIALCVIDLESKKLEYSGANNPCYIIRQSKIIELKADRMPIGIHPILRDFNSQYIQLEKDDVIYLFSDGYRDQIGEETLKKFKKEYFNNLLIDIQSLPLPQQAEVLDARHLKWRGNIEQTDDIMVMGLKI